MDVIKIKDLTKRFKDVVAVDNLNLTVRKGELFAFLGINGAGKSTTISIICGQLEKDSGTVTVNGYDLDASADKIKRDLGVVFQNSVLDKALTVYDNLEIKAALYGMDKQAFTARLNELCDMLGFRDILKRPVGKLSGGQRRKVDIARALLHSPKLLILDEPTTGLDPQTRHTIWDVLAKLRHDTDMTVFLTTHYMEEAADADYVVILDSGKIAAEGTPLQLKNTYSGDYITLYNTTEADIEGLNVKYEVLKGAVRIFVPDTSAATKLILENPDLFSDYEITKGKMDDVFLAATGKALTGGDNA